MVLGEQGEFLITRFHVKLTDVANALYYAIKGPSKWCGREVINILNNLLVSICSLDKRLEGNWASAFIRLVPKGEKQMLLNTETCKASVCIIFNLYNVSVELTIFDAISQVIMRPLLIQRSMQWSGTHRIPQGGGWQSICCVNWPWRRT